MIIKSTFKSFFKIKNGFNNKNKNIFVKNIFIFILLSKVILKKCKVSVNFVKVKKLRCSILKAPSRHKKYFHHTFMEIFFLKIKFDFKVFLWSVSNSIYGFLKLDPIFKKIGSNTLSRVKFLFSTKTVIPLNLL